MSGTSFTIIERRVGVRHRDLHVKRHAREQRRVAGAESMMPGVYVCVCEGRS